MVKKASPVSACNLSHVTVHVDADGKCPEALHYPARGYFWLDGHVVRAAEDGKLKFNIESNVWSPVGRRPGPQTDAPPRG